MQNSDLKKTFLASMRAVTSTVNVISASHEGERHAMTATSVTSLSLDPPSMLVCVNKDASIHKILSEGSHFSINILSSSQRELAEVCSNSDEGESRFVNESWKDQGSYIYNTDALSTLFCLKINEVDHTSHTIFIGRVEKAINNDELKPEELRTILQSSRVPKRQEEMLMGIFDMDNLSVNDVMIPKNEIIGVDLKNDLDIVIEQLHQIDFTYIPCFEDSIDNVLGFLTLNKKADFLGKEIKSIDSLKGELREPLFVPENTPLYKQLANFQSTGRRVGVIVDEYGDIEGIITLRAILEVIVGEISSETMDKMDILPQADGTYLIEGSMMIRDINRRLDWELPTEGPKTLSGLILEEIQTIPDTNVGLAIANYRIETVSIKDNVIKLAKLQKIDIEEETDEEQE